ncbi:MAG: hypothetical protein R2730_09085 [Chitinophagales bacterium]
MIKSMLLLFNNGKNASGELNSSLLKTTQGMSFSSAIATTPEECLLIKASKL